ncbi:MAG: hypothetical protein SFU98_14920 [Leptospiraceae bacterium]|nr:hypothetical protein [Leptospiraceae bacterium]
MKLLLLLLSLTSIYPDSFADLYESDKELYGSEKREKYKSTAVFWEIEDWEGHKSERIFFLYKNTNYPKYSSTRFFPFYSNVQSKIDKRAYTQFLNFYTETNGHNEENYIFPFYNFGKDTKINMGYFTLPFLFLHNTKVENKERNSNFWITPFFISDLSVDKDSKKDFDVSLFHYRRFDQFKGNSNSELFFLPIFYYENLVEEKNYNSKTQITPLYVSNERKTSTSDSINHFSLLHYRSNYKSNDETNSKTFFPILPLLFYDSNSIDKNYDDKLQITPLYLFSENKTSNSESLIHFTLLHFSSNYKSNDATNSKLLFPIIPILFYDSNSKDKNYDNKLQITPLYLFSENKTPNSESLTHFSLFHLRSTYKSNDETSSRLLFPLIPIIYFGTKNDLTHRNLFWIIDWEAKKENLTRLILAPIYFHFLDDAGTTQFHIPIVFHYSRDNYSLVPLLLTYYSPKTKESPKSTLVLTPFYISQDSEVSGSKYWILGITNLGFSKEGNYTNSYFFPFYYHSKNDSFFSLFYSRVFTDYEKDEFYTFGIPYYYSSTRQESNLYVGPFYKNGNLLSGIENFGLFPIYEFNRDKDGFTSHRSLFGLFEVSTNKFTEIDSARAIPLLIWYSRDNYIFSPLFNRYASDEGSGYSVKWGPFYYFRDGRKTSTNYALNFYNTVNHETTESSTVLFPFYFGSSNGLEGESTKFGPIYYFHKTKSDSTNYAFLFYNRTKQGNKFFTTLLPIYYAWETELSSASISPIQVNYKDHEGEFDVKLWQLGFASTKTYSITNPALSMDVGKKDNRYYLDTDISWFHSVFRFYTRVSVPDKPQEYLKFLVPDQKTKEEYIPKQTVSNENTIEKKVQSLNDNPEILKNKSNTSPKISKSKSFNRENSNYFYGWSALFYLFAYERGDTKHHWRAFPLAWFTWDDSSEDRVYVYPPFFVWYNSSDLEYFSIIPFYGKQRDTEGETRAYGIFGLIQEERKEKNYKETSVLWPFVNYYYSDDLSGYRIFPFFWSKSITNSEGKTEKNFSLLHYNRTNVRPNGLGSRFSYIFPFYVYDSTEFVGSDGKVFNDSTLYSILVFNGTNYSKKTPYKWWFSILPLLYLDTEDGFNWTAMLFFSGKDRTNEKEFFFWPIVPVIYSNTTVSPKDSSIKNSFFIFPYYSKRNEFKKENFVYDWKVFFPFYSYENINNKANTESGWSKETFTSLVYSSWNHKNKQGIESGLFITPLTYYFERNNDSITTRVLYFIKYESSKDTSEFSFLPFWNFESKEKRNEKDNSIESYSKIRYFIPVYYRNNAYPSNTKPNQLSESTKFNFFPLYFSNTEEDNSWLFITPLAYYYERYNDSITSRILYFIKYESSKNTSEFSFLPFFDFESKEKRSEKDNSIQSYSKTRYFFPVYYSNSAYPNPTKPNQLTESTNFHLFPLYFSNTQENNSWLFLLGFYHENYKIGYTQSFLWYLVYHNSLDTNYREIDLLLSLYNYKVSRDSTSVNLAYGILSRYKNDKSINEFKTLWLGYEIGKESFYLNIFPFYIYQKDKTSDSQWILPILGIMTNDTNEEMNLFGLGAVYYHKKNPKQKKELTHLLLGTAYYHSKKPERGYQSRGSVWGWLWEYETEEDNYYKFSILKIFSYEESKGKTRLLGIPVN